MKKLKKFCEYQNLVDVAYYKNSLNQRHGLHKTFWKNGELSAEFAYLNGLITGVSKYYFKNRKEFGSIETARAHMFNGIRIRLGL